MRVLVHADDLGLSPAVNEAIGRSCRAGWVQSVSALATGPAFAHAAAGSLPADADVGVHLDLTEFASLTGVAALEDLRGLAAKGGAPLLTALDRLGSKSPSVVESEWAAQIEAVRAWWTVSHLDSHQHIHWRPALWPPLRNVMRRMGVRAVRGVAPWRPEADAAARALQRGRAARFRAAFRDWVTTDAVANPAAFRWLLANPRRQPPVVELIVHPGNPAHPHYEADMHWLVEACGVLQARHRPVSWRELVGDSKDRMHKTNGHPSP